MAESTGQGLVIEGSALWPEFMVELELKHVKAIWLTASDSLFKTRIHQGSNYAHATDNERQLIDKFVGRTLLYNKRMKALVKRQGLCCVDVETVSSVEELTEKCLELLDMPID